MKIDKIAADGGKLEKKEEKNEGTFFIFWEKKSRDTDLRWSNWAKFIFLDIKIIKILMNKAVIYVKSQA